MPKIASASSLPSTGTIQAVAIFARFADEEPADVPGYAADLFRPELEGSVSHFYAEMSRGQLAVSGEALSREYDSSLGTSAYLSSSSHRPGDFGQFSREILTAADEDVDFGQFDNDGPDGRPNSGDDDGTVDAVFLILRDIPSGFLVGDADGLAQLGLEAAISTNDPAASGGRIRIRADGITPGGTIQGGSSLSEVAGIIAHELGHLLGLPDLFDTDFTTSEGDLDPEKDSAGIGYWGLMGHGAQGWNNAGGPTPFCVWSLKRLGWIGRANRRLRTVTESETDAIIADVHGTGEVIEIRLGGPEYLLLAHRQRSGSYYDRDLPAEGLLIWHVNDALGNNATEATKRVDLVCADGRFFDAGFPQGDHPGFDDGGDNLDFWSHDTAISEGKAGNLGDATDVFDGVKYTQFSPISNPSAQGVSVEHIRRIGETMVVDIDVADRRRAGDVDTRETWSDTVEVVGDITVSHEAQLDIAPGTVILFGPDTRQWGTDRDRCEFDVFGGLTAFGNRGPDRGRRTKFGSAENQPEPGDWAGIRLHANATVNFRSVEIVDAARGVHGAGLTRTQYFDDVQFRNITSDAIDIIFEMRPPRGDSVENADLMLHDLDIESVGGRGISVGGEASVEITGTKATGCSGAGLHCSSRRLRCATSEFTGNGVTEGYEVVIERDVVGEIEDNRFRGEGTGVLFNISGDVILKGNRFDGYDKALIARSAKPRIINNVFANVDTVIEVTGFVVPEDIQLNSVDSARWLVVNRTDVGIDVARNWWGTSDVVAIAAGMIGDVTFSPVLNFDPQLSVNFHLEQNRPNPFNVETVIDFTVGIMDASLSSAEMMTLDIHNITGGHLRRLVEAPPAPGVYTVVWDGRDDDGLRAASGVYYCELSVGGITLHRKLTLLR
ncbi:MAG: FlgD immunoglobulin-like domain containing protein [Candidatus Latescibacterota bacterium]|nr:FlgD immunoglobulin-like domain containing protein [Candidatus Latescibacterota bacterium]